MNNPVLNFLFGLWYLALFAPLTIIGGLATLFIGLFSRRAARNVTNVPWAHAALRPAFISIRSHGRENLPAGRGGYILYINHTSTLDIPAVSVSTGLSVTWVAKASLAQIPFFGWGLVGGGHMLVDREGGPSAARAMVEEAAKRLEEGQILAIFPEGTRNRGGQPLLPFKKGAFILAKHTSAPMVPVAIKNAGQLWPAGKLWPRPGVIRVKFGPPLQPRPEENLAGLTQRAQEALLAMLTDESW